MSARLTDATLRAACSRARITSPMAQAVPGPEPGALYLVLGRPVPAVERKRRERALTAVLRRHTGDDDVVVLVRQYSPWRGTPGRGERREFTDDYPFGKPPRAPQRQQAHRKAA